ncbi:hypothetical protein D3C75_844300 [compost metagenome]
MQVSGHVQELLINAKRLHLVRVTLIYFGNKQRYLNVHPHPWTDYNQVGTFASGLKYPLGCCHAVRFGDRASSQNDSGPPIRVPNGNRLILQLRTGCFLNARIK